jgi:putative ABC transport system permease protein
MKLALRELVRKPGRFVTATIILFLVSVLIMLFGGILDSLINNSINGITAQRGDLIVFSDGSEQSFLRSRVDADVRAQVEAVPGVTEVGGLGVVQLGARVPGKGPRDLVDTALFGYETAPRGVPAVPPADGEVIADRSLRDRGIREGMEILLGPARTPVTVVGFVERTNYLGQGSLWGNLTTWRTVLSANRPDEILPATTVQSLVVSGDPDPAALAAAIDAATGATDTLTVTAAADGLPGVAEQRATFAQIINTIVFIALVVVALFFVLLTVERTGLYGVLKAIGAGSRTLFAGVVLQAVIVTLAASALAALVAVVLAVSVPESAFPFEIGVGRILTSTITLLVASIVGCVFSLRRVLKIDPASAIGGSV